MVKVVPVLPIVESIREISAAPNILVDFVEEFRPDRIPHTFRNASP